MELILYRGIPASGKSTYAKAWVAAAPNRVRINRDDIRFQMYGVYFGGKINEDVVTKIEDAAIAAALEAGQSVVVDDTNIRHAYVKRIAEIGAEFGAAIVVKNFPISLEEAKSRNANRDRKVPDDVIEKMHQAFKSSGTVALPTPMPVQPFVAKPGTPKAILVDIDGIVAHNDGHRSFYDWLAVGKDQPIQEVIEIVWMALENQYKVIFMSGRDGVCQPQTEDWLDDNVGYYDALFMRAEGDQRKDNIVKQELFDAHIRDNYDVKFVLDDRDQVVKMWRAMGLRCLQVAPGNF